MKGKLSILFGAQSVALLPGNQEGQFVDMSDRDDVPAVIFPDIYITRVTVSWVIEFVSAACRSPPTNARREELSGKGGILGGLQRRWKWLGRKGTWGRKNEMVHLMWADRDDVTS